MAGACQPPPRSTGRSQSERPDQTPAQPPPQGQRPTLLLDRLARLKEQCARRLLTPVGMPSARVCRSNTCPGEFSRRGACSSGLKWKTQRSGARSSTPGSRSTSLRLSSREVPSSTLTAPSELALGTHAAVAFWRRHCRRRGSPRAPRCARARHQSPMAHAPQAPCSSCARSGGSTRRMRLVLRPRSRPSRAGCMRRPSVGSVKPSAAARRAGPSNLRPSWTLARTRSPRCSFLIAPPRPRVRPPRNDESHQSNSTRSKQSRQ